MGGQEEEAQVLPDSDSAKRKLEDNIALKKRAEEYIARIVSNAEAKRPRLDEAAETLVSVSVPESVSPVPPSSDIIQKPASQPTPTAQVGLSHVVVQPGSYYGSHGPSKKIDIPNGKVGVIIGKGGDTIKRLQLHSGARIQITKDTEADPYSQTRDVELSGTQEQISRAEQLIKDEIEASDAAGSGLSVAGGYNSVPGTEHFEMKVPNNKVALIIGKQGDNIKNMQSTSGARIQVIPLRLPPGDTSTERSVHMYGNKEQIEAAKALVNEVISENRVRNPSMSSSYMQQGYQPSGNWAPTGPPPVQQPSYAYTQPGTYPTAPPPYYGSYPPQPAQWDQTNASGAPLPPQQNTGYNYYGQQDQTESGSAQAIANYGYHQNPSLNTQSYDSGYSQAPQSYGQEVPAPAPQHEQQNQYATSGYGTSVAPSHLDGTNPPQPYGSQPSSQPPPVYPVTYGQPPAIPPVGYGSSQNYMGAAPHPPVYDQSGYSQQGYGGQPTQPPAPIPQPYYGQPGYPPQSVPPQASYIQATNPVYGQNEPHAQPAAHGYSQAHAYGAGNGDGNAAPTSYGTAPAAQDAVQPQS